MIRHENSRHFTNKILQWAMQRVACQRSALRAPLHALRFLIRRTLKCNPRSCYALAPYTRYGRAMRTLKAQFLVRISHSLIASINTQSRRTILVAPVQLECAAPRHVILEPTPDLQQRGLHCTIASPQVQGHPVPTH